MMSNSVGTYLRFLRRKSGLSQRNLALILGSVTASQISRHERSIAPPSLSAALGYQVVFRMAVSEIFPGLYHAVEEGIEERLSEFEGELKSSTVKGRGAASVARELEWFYESIRNRFDEHMELRIYDPRIIALDLRVRRSGFATFEGPRRLLDFGTIDLRLGNTDNRVSRLSHLVRLTNPKVLLVKKERWCTLIARSDAKLVIRALANIAMANSINIRLIEQRALSSAFENLGCSTKADISASLARVFPELVWILPPKRRIWEPEHSRQTVFDAIALGMAYWQSETDAVKIEIRQSGIVNTDI